MAKRKEKKPVKTPEDTALETLFGTNKPLIEEAARLLHSTPTEYVNGVVSKNANVIVTKMKQMATTNPQVDQPKEALVAPVEPPKQVETKVAVQEEKAPVPLPVLPVVKKKPMHPCMYFNKNGTDARLRRTEYEGTCNLKGNVACSWQINTARNCPTFKPVPGFRR